MLTPKADQLRRLAAYPPRMGPLPLVGGVESAASTTPLWVPLLVALLGVIGTAAGTIVGVVMTQHAARQREADARTHELERERARWAREDEARTFEHRRQAYLDLYVALRDVMDRFDELKPGDTLPQWRDVLWGKFPAVGMYGSNAVAELSDTAVDLLITSAMQQGRAAETAGDMRELALDAFSQLRNKMREELGVPDGPGMPTAEREEFSRLHEQAMALIYAARRPADEQVESAFPRVEVDSG